MRANTLSPARIARAVSAILLLSLLQVVVAPVLAPSTFSAPANATIFDANNFTLAGNALNCGTTTCAAVPTTYNTLTPTSTNVAGEVQLTAASSSQAGFAWSKERITLGSSFDIQAQIYLGSSNGGADGLAFVLQTASTSAGSVGGGIGYLNIPQPCFAVEFDTYQNNDIANDHAALMRCSSVDNHNYFTSGNLSTSSQTTGSVDLGDIEDGYWRNVRFIWTAPATPTAAGTFVVKFDRLHDGVDDANDTLFTTSINFYDYFGSASVGSVYWGFTAATGGAVNVQAVKGLDYVVVPRVNAAPTISTAPTNDTVNTAAGTYTKTFLIDDDSTLQGQWTFATTSSNQGRVTTTSTAATSATAATTTYTLIGSSGATTISITAYDADGASVSTSFAVSLSAQSALSVSSTSGTYGTALKLTSSGGSGTGAVSYATTTPGCSITNTDSLTATSALTCSVTATKVADSSYSAISSSATNVVLATRPITIKAAAKSASYTGSSVSVSNSYSITSGTLASTDTFTALTYTYTSTPLSYNSATAPTNAGTYTITPSAASFSVGSASNYSITYETATLTIAVAAQSALTLSSTSGVYGTTLKLTTTGGSGTGAVSYSPGTAGCTVTNTDSLTVTSALTCSVTATKAADSNYSVISSSATNVVFSARPITIKAADNTETYNGTPASITNSYSITSGTLVGSDTFTALTYTYSSAGYSASQTAPTNAGSYTITPSAASFSVGSAANYSITYDTATLTINKANQGSLTITTTTSKYGTPLYLQTSGGSGTGSLSYAITSAGSASGCSITSETITVSSIGTCKVTATKALDTNYFVVSSAETTITFAKADSITVTTTLSTSSVTYTEAPAAITATQTVTGLVNSETATVTSTYTANSCEYGGTCVIGNVAPGGGYVFYVSATTINVATGISTGGIYLATAPQTWSGGSIDPNASFGCGSTNIASTSDSVGSGAENTRLINAGCATAGIASRLAADSSAEGFTDWFIPSLDELTLIYNNLKVNSLSNLQSWNYWSSTQGSTSAYGKYWWFGSGAVSGQTDKNNSAGSNMYVRPIRAFSPTALASATVPTDAGVYKVGSTFAISSPASLSNYQGVESVTATLTINKANQIAITFGQYLAYPNISSYPLNVYGGSGPGIMTRTLVSAGTAGCSLASVFILTATSVGSCTVKAEKAGTRNYIVESTTATIYWIAWLDNYATQTLGGNNVIPLAGGNQIIVRTETLTASAFSNTSGGAITSAAVGTTIRINSTGFSGLSTSDLSVTFRTYEDAVINAVTSTYVEVVIPSGAVTGVIAIDSPRGVAYTQSFTISP